MLTTRKAFLASVAALPLQLSAQTAIVFQGFPLRKSVNQIVQEDSSNLDDKQSKEFVCIISRRDGKYYWTSRNNIEVTRIESGPFITFSAMNGSGYVRYTQAVPDSPIDYMEHLIDKLFTITYWGKSSVIRA